MLEYARLGSGWRLHILDTTGIEVALETATYECSGVVKNDDGSYTRGYKLATLRTLLDTAGYCQLKHFLTKTVAIRGTRNVPDLYIVYPKMANFV